MYQFPENLGIRVMYGCFFCMGYIILYLPSDDVLRASSACVCFFGFKSVATTDFQTSEASYSDSHIQIPRCEEYLFCFFESPGRGTYPRVWVSKGSHRVVLGRKSSCSLQGKRSMIDTSDIVILSHIKKSLDFHRHTTYTQKSFRQLIIHEE